MIKPSGFGAVQVMVDAGLQPIQVTGIAGLDLQGANNNDYTRDDLVFLVPQDNNGTPLAYADSTRQLSVIVFPATIDNRGGGGNNFGYGVDQATIRSVAGPNNQANAEVTAKVVVEGTRSFLYRVGFLVTIGPPYPIQ
jgi:hypothetical protein